MVFGSFTTGAEGWSALLPEFRGRRPTVPVTYP
jgi:hypothetical protein